MDEFSGAKDHARREFSSQKFDWIDALNADQRVDGTAFKVGVCIQQHVNRSTLTTNVSDETVANKTGLSIRTVIRARNRLKKLGWLDWKRTRGASIYRVRNEPLVAILEQQNILRKAREERRESRFGDARVWKIEGAD